jgi:tRNA(Ile)-lysidine synthase
MASSRKPKYVTDVAAVVEAVLGQHVRPGDRLCSALSGGLDSVVLLDILSRLRRRLGIRLSAVHVNHGFSPNAADWAGYCARLCSARRIPLTVVEICVVRRAGESLEARARDARHEVFRGQQADFVVLAHNRDDQAETLLLQLLRGAGVKGLAAMPVLREQARASRIEDRGKTSHAGQGARLNPQSSILIPRLLRPLLEIPRAEIEDYGLDRHLSWVEDESNADPRFDRNYLRMEIVPRLEARFKGARGALARASRHLAEAARLLDALADVDAAAARDGDALRIEALTALGPARARNLLRRLIECRGGSMPNEASLDEGLRQLLSAKRDARVRVALGEFELRRHGGLAFLERVAVEVPDALDLEWTGEAAVELGPGLGRLRFKRARGKGLSLPRLEAARVTVRLRRGGERLRPDERRPRRTLKHLLQASGVPEWERGRMPLLFSGERLAWVPGIGGDAEFRCGPRERGVEVYWERD